MRKFSLVMLSVGAIAALVSSLLLLVDGRDLAAGVWLCASLLCSVLIEMEGQ